MCNIGLVSKCVNWVNPIIETIGYHFCVLKRERGVGFLVVGARVHKSYTYCVCVCESRKCGLSLSLSARLFSVGQRLIAGRFWRSHTHSFGEYARNTNTHSTHMASAPPPSQNHDDDVCLSVCVSLKMSPRNGCVCHGVRHSPTNLGPLARKNPLDTQKWPSLQDILVPLKIPSLQLNCSPAVAIESLLRARWSFNCRFALTKARQSWQWSGEESAGREKCGPWRGAAAEHTYRSLDIGGGGGGGAIR